MKPDTYFIVGAIWTVISPLQPTETVQMLTFIGGIVGMVSGLLMKGKDD